MADPPSRPAELITAINGALVDRVLSMKASVRRLNLSQNAIAQVDAALSRLAPTLQSLDVRGNRLTRIDGAFSELKALGSLYAAGNAISDISGLAGCAELRKLDLSGNQLCSFESLLPLQGLRSLQWLRLKGNPVCSALPQQAYRDAVKRILPQLAVLDDQPYASASPSSSSSSAAADGVFVPLTARSDLTAVIAPAAAVGVLSPGRWSGHQQQSSQPPPTALIRARTRAALSPPLSKSQPPSKSQPASSSVSAPPAASHEAAIASNAPAIDTAAAGNGNVTSSPHGSDSTASPYQAASSPTVTTAGLHQHESALQAAHNAELDSLRQQLSEVQSALESARAHSSELEGQESEHRADIASLRSSLEEANAALQAAASRADDAQAEVSKLRSSLSARESALADAAALHASAAKEAQLSHEAELASLRAEHAAQAAAWEDERGRWRGQLTQQAHGYESRLGDMSSAVERARQEVMAAAVAAEAERAEVESTWSARLSAEQEARNADAAAAQAKMQDAQVQISALEDALRMSQQETLDLISQLGAMTDDVSRRMDALASVSSSALQRLGARLDVAQSHLATAALATSADARLLSLLHWAVEGERSSWSEALTAQPRRAAELREARVQLVAAASAAGLAISTSVPSSGDEAGHYISDVVAAGYGDGILQHPQQLSDYELELLTSQQLMEAVSAALEATNRQQQASGTGDSARRRLVNGSSHDVDDGIAGAYLSRLRPSALALAQTASALSRLSDLQHSHEAEIDASAQALAAACAATDYLLTLVASSTIGGEGSSVAAACKATSDLFSSASSSAGGGSGALASARGLPPEVTNALSAALQQLPPSTASLSSSASLPSHSPPLLWPPELLQASQVAVSLLDADTVRSELATVLIERKALQTALKNALESSLAVETDTISQLQASLTQLQQRFDSSLAESARLSAANKGLRARLAEAASEGVAAKARAEAAASARLEAAQCDLAGANAHIASLQQQLDSVRAEAGRARDEIGRLEGELTAQARRHSDLHARYMEESSSAQARLTEQAAANQAILMDQLASAQASSARLSEAAEGLQREVDGLRRERDNLLNLALEFGLVVPTNTALPMTIASSGGGSGVGGGAGNSLSSAALSVPSTPFPYGARSGSGMSHGTPASLPLPWPGWRVFAPPQQHGQQQQQQPQVQSSAAYPIQSHQPQHQGAPALTSRSSASGASANAPYFTVSPAAAGILAARSRTGSSNIAGGGVGAGGTSAGATPVGLQLHTLHTMHGHTHSSGVGSGGSSGVSGSGLPSGPAPSIAHPPSHYPGGPALSQAAAAAAAAASALQSSSSSVPASSSESGGGGGGRGVANAIGAC